MAKLRSIIVSVSVFMETMWFPLSFDEPEVSAREFKTEAKVYFDDDEQITEELIDNRVERSIKARYCGRSNDIEHQLLIDVLYCSLPSRR